MPKLTRTKEAMKLYQRDRQARLRHAREVLMVQIHSGMKSSIEVGPDGKARLKMTTQFNKEQWDAICEWAEVEHTDPEILMEDLIRQLLLSWRREHDARRHE